MVENQYGRADHDHLTRGLVYTVARQARHQHDKETPFVVRVYSNSEWLD